jgi:hemoglobin
MVASNEHFYVPPSGPPTGPRPNPEIYHAMGEERIFKLLEDFYRELEGSSIRDLFPVDMAKASEKSGAFFVFLLGGPPLYQERYGSPMMRQRHMPFKIDEAARQTWLSCFRKVLQGHEDIYHFPKQYADEFWTFIERFSAWMVNTK